MHSLFCINPAVPNHASRWFGSFPCLSLLPEQVQLQLLTATVKLFLKKPTDSVQRMIQLVLSAATNETDNPDLRDRAYVYWRLLSTDPEVRRRLWPFA